MLTRGECVPQCNSLLPANQKDVLAHVQQRSPLIFHQHCSGNVSHSLLQWHWASPGEHMAFCSTPSLRSHCLRLHQLLLSLRGSIYLGFFVLQVTTPSFHNECFQHLAPRARNLQQDLHFWAVGARKSRDPSQTHTFTCIQTGMEQCMKGGEGIVQLHQGAAAGGIVLEHSYSRQHHFCNKQVLI